MTRVLDAVDLVRGETAYEFEGHRHDAGVSFIVIEAPPGSGLKLHRHPYEEAFPAGVPHRKWSYKEWSMKTLDKGEIRDDAK